MGPELLIGLMANWKLALGGIVLLGVSLFVWNYFRRGRKIARQKRIIKGHKIKDRVQERLEEVEREGAKKLKEVDGAETDTLLDRLNDMPE